MLRKMMITTATVALMTSGAMASETGKTATEDTMNTTAAYAFSPSADMFAVSDLMGSSVFTSDAADAERIGEVSNVILSREGTVEAIVVDVGGFLGIGEKPVALDYSKANWTKDEDGNRHVTITVDKATLEQARAFDPDSLDAERHGAMDNESRDNEQTALDNNAAESTETEKTASADERMEEKPVKDTAAVQDTADDGVTAVEKTDQAAAPSEEEQTAATEQRPGLRDGLSLTDRAELSAEDLIGATVYGANDDSIGEVGDIILSDKEEIEAYIIEVGGFLGIGEKPVAIDSAELEIMSDQGGNLFIFTPFSEEQLENQPAYDESAYEADRDGNVLRR
jgi:sporulation protein YlmC with PRC-barrel domain